MPVRALVLSAAVALAACDGPSPFSEARVYARDLVEAQTGTPALTPADCAAAQPDPGFFINCWQTLVLCPSGDAELMLTDIVERGRYVVDGRAVRFDRDGGGTVHFSLSPGGREAERVGTGERWVRWSPADERAVGALGVCRS